MSVSDGVGKRHGRRLRLRRGVAMVVAIGAAMLGGIAVSATSASASELKDYVCKYVGSPGDSRLDHVIWENSGKSGTGWFNDAQPSYVLYFNVERKTPEPSLSECPSPKGYPVIPPEYIAPDCDVEGSVVANNTDGYTWLIDGGKYTAVPKTIPGSHPPRKYVLSGETQFGPYALSKIPSQSTNSAGACYVAPDTSITVNAPTFARGTCTAVGSLVAKNTAAYSWTRASTETQMVYTAVANGSYTLTGQVSWTFDLTKLTKLASQSVDPKRACYVARPPAGVVVTPVVAGEVVTAQPATVPTKVVKGAVVTNAPVVAPAKVTQLAFTGAETVPLGLSGLLALLLGVGLILVSRRRATD